MNSLVVNIYLHEKENRGHSEQQKENKLDKAETRGSRVAVFASCFKCLKKSAILCVQVK